MVKIKGEKDIDLIAEVLHTTDAQESIILGNIPIITITQSYEELENCYLDSEYR